MFIHRTIYTTLESQRDNKKITVLVGARQVGKTTLMKRLFAAFAPDTPCLFLDMDIHSQYEQVRTYENCMATLRLHGYQEQDDKLFILFLDEFQRYPDTAIVLKNLADHHPNIKVYASGSSSLAINDRIQESLAGRKRIVHVHPLSFREYLVFTGRGDLVDMLSNLPTVRSDNLRVLLPDVYTRLEEFLIFGGYPEVALVPIPEKQEVLSSIFDLYVKKDLVDFLKMERINQVKTLIIRLALNNGQECRYNRLAQITGLPEKSIKGHMEILKETFLITIHTPWFTNRNKELIKTPKVYFLDNGVRNFFINNFNEASLREDTSYAFEGFVVSEMIKAGIKQESIKFWRTKAGNEVDLILEQGGTITPIEIKYKNAPRKTDFNGLKRFKTLYPDSETPCLINMGSNRPENNSFRVASPFEIDTFLQDICR